MQEKYCPLLFSSDLDSLPFCKGAHCAWYIPPQGRGQAGGCALAYLPEIARGVLRL